MTTNDAETLTLLGAGPQPAQQKLERFEAPACMERVELRTAELICHCPVTGQPDIYEATIAYGPEGWALETKSVKLYLWTFAQGPGIFAEHLVDLIAGDVAAAAAPRWVRVTLVQNIRGGIVTTVTATRGEAP